MPSPPSRAAWIEIRRGLEVKTSDVGRRLHGRRGLKSLQSSCGGLPNSSPPSRAAWIEMTMPCALPQNAERRRLHGRRGLK